MRISLLFALLLMSISTYAATAPETYTPEHRAAVARAYQQQATTTLDGKPRRVTLKERILRRWVKRKMRKKAGREFGAVKKVHPLAIYALLSNIGSILTIGAMFLFSVGTPWGWLFLLFGSGLAYGGLITGLVALNQIKEDKAYRGKHLAIWGGIVFGLGNFVLCTFIGLALFIMTIAEFLASL